MGKAKLAPHPAHRIPCLELCAAVLAAEMVDVEMHAVRFLLIVGLFLDISITNKCVCCQQSQSHHEIESSSTVCFHLAEPGGSRHQVQVCRHPQSFKLVHRSRIPEKHK